MLDITGAEDIEISLSNGPSDTLVLHVNTKDGCRLRICKIKGKVTIGVQDKNGIAYWGEHHA